MLMYHNPYVLPTQDYSDEQKKNGNGGNEIITLREFYLAIATLAAHEYFAFGCGSQFA
jgi:hypothetical protein